MEWALAFVTARVLAEKMVFLEVPPNHRFSLDEFGYNPSYFLVYIN